MIKIALVGIGLEKYWEQFEGLLERLEGYQNSIARRMLQNELELINCGIIDTPNKARACSEVLAKNDIDLVFIYVSTYALSATILPIANKLNVPVIILNLQPVASLDYAAFNNINDRGIMTGIWLEHCQSCSVPEIASVFNKAGVRYDIVSGYLDDSIAWNEIDNWVAAAHVAKSISENRLGVLGHYYNGMLDVYSDLTKHSTVFGTHFELLEMCELKKIRDAVTAEEISEKLQNFYEAFEVVKECSKAELERAAKTSVALDKLVQIHDLNSLAYYYEGEAGNDYQNIVTSFIAGSTLLTGSGIPVAGECEIKNAQAMKIMSSFGAGGSFSEFYLTDFKEDVILLGHDGPAHFAMAEGKVKLVPLPVYHGKPGKGLSIQMSVKNGPVTLLSVVEGNEGIFLLTAEGHSVEGPVLQIGNTNSRYKFSIGVRDFINSWSKKGPSHHCAIGVGHIADKIDKLGMLLNIPVVKIC